MVRYGLYATKYSPGPTLFNLDEDVEKDFNESPIFAILTKSRGKNECEISATPVIFRPLNEYIGAIKYCVGFKAGPKL